ncbi:hypothetical protein B0H14DRAFT_2625987 [Mycena olivaceomarginata]|nr:hypothetical protein B0H14DRAFT_2625987 [Mycena olivaceomarginata]
MIVGSRTAESTDVVVFNPPGFLACVSLQSSLEMHNDLVGVCKSPSSGSKPEPRPGHTFLMPGLIPVRFDFKFEMREERTERLYISRKCATALPVLCARCTAARLATAEQACSESDRIRPRGFYAPFLLAALGQTNLVPPTPTLASTIDFLRLPPWRVVAICAGCWAGRTGRGQRAAGVEIELGCREEQRIKTSAARRRPSTRVRWLADLTLVDGCGKLGGYERITRERTRASLMRDEAGRDRVYTRVARYLVAGSSARGAGGGDAQGPSSGGVDGAVGHGGARTWYRALDAHELANAEEIRSTRRSARDANRERGLKVQDSDWTSAGGCRIRCVKQRLGGRASGELRLADVQRRRRRVRSEGCWAVRCICRRGQGEGWIEVVKVREGATAVHCHVNLSERGGGDDLEIRHSCLQ